MIDRVCSGLPAFAFACATLLMPCAVAPVAVAEVELRGPAQQRIKAAFADMERTRNLLITRDGQPVIEHVERDLPLDRAANVKSLAKIVMSALVGAAIERGVIEDAEQPIAELLGDLVPPGADPRVADVTVGHLLSMQAGLRRTSGRHYGAWVNSDDWVAHVLTRPFVDEPGGGMLYSTGNYHLLSAALARATGRSTLALAREWLGEPLGIRIPAWQTDPQGIHFGGNNMRLSARALARIAELYHRDGRYGGERVLAPGWVEQSWARRTRSRYTGEAYGYGWFTTELAGETVRYGWGYGGQFLYLVPRLDLTLVLLSDSTPPSPQSALVRRVHVAVAEEVIPVARDRAAGLSGRVGSSSSARP
jgi:CubicO group peptidase (beta-lactamase class C family)